MPDLPFPFTQVQSWQEMVDTSQRYFEDLYQDRIGGALLGDVFVIGVDDVLAVNLGLGLTKAGNELAVKNHATGGLTATADGEMVKCKADGGLSTDADGLYLVTGIKEGHLIGMQVTIKDSANLYIWGGSIDINGVIYNATAQITFPTGTLTAATLYYLYVSAPGSGTTLAAGQFSLSTTGCTYDHAKGAYYMTGDGSKRWLANVGCGMPIPRTWTELMPVGDADRSWWPLACDYVGSRIIVAVGILASGRCYISSNYGASWAETMPAGDTNKEWQSLSVSGDGTHLLAGSYGKLYLSTNSGASWAEVQPFGAYTGNRQWRCSSINQDGSVMVVGQYFSGYPNDGKVWISVNYGADWSDCTPPGASSGRWFAIAANASGSTVVALPSFVGDTHVYVSTNYGVSWTAHQPDPISGIEWTGAAVSASGSVIVVCGVVHDVLFVSTDGGASWAECSPYSPLHPTAVSCNSVGNRIAVCGGNGYVFASDDYGTTWQNEDPDSSGVTRFWRSVKMNYSGSRLLAVYDRLWSELWSVGPLGSAWVSQPIGDIINLRRNSDNVPCESVPGVIESVSQRIGRVALLRRNADNVPGERWPEQ